MSLCDLSAQQLIEGYRSGEFSPVKATNEFLMRVLRLNPLLNAFSFIDSEGALAAAKQSERRWAAKSPLSTFDGLPATIKDQWLLKGTPTRRGSLTTDGDDLATEDSPAAQRLREGGAVFLGKTTLCEFSWNGVNRSRLTGEGRNPWNVEKNSGGSSGGAAIAAATRMGLLHIASDGAGSIRIPAAFCGVFGFKPTYGRVPAYPQGLLPNCSHTGPITKTTYEAALMLDAITQYDPREWLATGDPKREYVARLDEGVAGLRIGFTCDMDVARPEPAIAAAVERVANVFRSLGAAVSEIPPQSFPDARLAFEIIYRTSLAASVTGIPEHLHSQLDPGLVRNAGIGSGYSVETLMKALGEREKLGRQMNLLHTQYDLLITPQVAVTAFDCGMDVPKGSQMSEWFDWSPYTYLLNLTQQPAASVPCGLDPDGLPLAVQLIGPRHGDLSVLQAARAFENVCPFGLPDIEQLA